MMLDSGHIGDCSEIYITEHPDYCMTIESIQRARLDSMFFG
jgi:hypothetical protein